MGTDETGLRALEHPAPPLGLSDRKHVRLLDSDPFREGLHSLSRYFIGGAGLEETLLAVSEMTTRAVVGADFAGMSMWTGDHMATRAYTDRESPEVDEAQYQSGEGPCLDAFRENAVFWIPDMAAETRWPAFSALCLEHGVHSTLSTPLNVDGKTFGALNIYARQRNAFSEADLATAVVFAESAAVVVANARAYWNAYDLAQNLGDAMSSRAVIEQAKGILIGQSGLSDDEAFDTLVRASQRENRKLRDIALELVENARRRRQPVSDPPA